MQDSPPSGLSSARTRRGDVRLRLTRAMRRVVRSLFPSDSRRGVAGLLGSPPRPESAPPDVRDPRLRAREVLAEARAQMPSLLDDARPDPVVEPAELVTPEPATLRRALRSYTDHVERLLTAAEEERRALRAQVNQLSEELLVLRAEVHELRAALPAPASESVPALIAPAPDSPSGAAPAGSDEEHGRTGAEPEEAQTVIEQAAAAPDEGNDSVASSPEPPETDGPGVPSARSGEDAALASRLFPAGTIGVQVILRPCQRPRHVEAICRRLADESPIEHAASVPSGDQETRLRVRFRRPVHWPWLRDAIERAAGAAIDPTTATVEAGVVRLRLRFPHRSSGEPPVE